MVYGRGDEESSKQELQEAVQDTLGTSTEAAAETSPLLPPPAATAPVALPQPAAVSDPIVVRSSFKSTMNMMSGSYSR